MDKDTFSTIIWIGLILTVLYGMDTYKNITVSENTQVTNVDAPLSDMQLQELKDILNKDSETINIIQAMHATSETDAFIEKYLYRADDIRTYEIEGVSMQPTFFSGNTIIVKDIEFDKIKEGDIIVAEHNGEKMAHRVRGVYSAGYLVTQGDSNRQVEYCTANNTLGIVIGVLYS